MALNSLGLNPTDQEVVDIPVKIARKGLIYFPDFCMICLRYLKKDEDEQFHHWMFKVPTPTYFTIGKDNHDDDDGGQKLHCYLIFSRGTVTSQKPDGIFKQMLCGTEPYPLDFRAKKYKLDKHSMKKKDFIFMMTNLPTHVEDWEAEEMFDFADKNKDGELSYKEFLIMINPPPPPVQPKPHISEFLMQPEVVLPNPHPGNSSGNISEVRIDIDPPAELVKPPVSLEVEAEGVGAKTVRVASEKPAGRWIL